MKSETANDVGLLAEQNASMRFYEIKRGDKEVSKLTN